MNAAKSRRRLAKGRRSRQKKAYLAEVRRQCRLANKADKRDNWEQYLYQPE